MGESPYTHFYSLHLHPQCKDGGGSASQFIANVTWASPGSVPSLLRKDYLPAGRSEIRESADEVSRGRVWNPDDQCGWWWHNAPSRTANSASNREEAHESTSPNEADTSSHQLWTQLAAVELWSVLFSGVGSSLRLSTCHFTSFQQLGIACNFIRSDNVIHLPTETWPFPSTSEKNDTGRQYLDTKKLGWVSLSVWFQGQNREVAYIGKKNLVTPGNFKREQENYPFKMHSLPSLLHFSQCSFFFFSGSIENWNCPVGPFKPRKAHSAPRFKNTWFIWKQK